MTVEVKRVYDEPDADDGLRILVDRLWPRGMRKDDAHLDRWMKEAAPSSELRTWFHSGDARSRADESRDDRYEEFSRRYRAELADGPALAELAALADEQGRLTLLYAARDEARNHALVLRDAVLAYRDAADSGDAGRS